MPRTPKPRTATARRKAVQELLRVGELLAEVARNTAKMFPVTDEADEIRRRLRQWNVACEEAYQLFLPK